MKAVIITLSLTFSLVMAPLAVQAMDGARVFGWCKNDHQRLLATIYVSGVIDTMLEDEGKKINVCVPGLLSRMTIADLTCEWLEANPMERGQSAVASTRAALEAEYPCP